MSAFINDKGSNSQSSLETQVCGAVTRGLDE